MPWAPIIICGSMIAATGAVATFWGQDPKVVGIIIALLGLCAIALIVGLFLLFLKAEDRALFRQAILKTAREDISKFFALLAFRR